MAARASALSALSPSSDVQQAAQIAAPRQLRFFRVDDHDISKLVEEELIGDEGTSDNKQALKQATALKQIATPEDILYVF